MLMENMVLTQQILLMKPNKCSPPDGNKHSYPRCLLSSGHPTSRPFTQKQPARPVMSSGKIKR